MNWSKSFEMSRKFSSIVLQNKFCSWRFKEDNDNKWIFLNNFPRIDDVEQLKKWLNDERFILECLKRVFEKSCEAKTRFQIFYQLAGASLKDHWRKNKGKRLFK